MATRPMHIERLTVAHAQAYRDLMLQAYAQHPDAFTSSAQERAALPLSWWRQRLSGEPDATEQVWGAWQGETLCGVVGLSFKTREKIRHKSTLFGLFVSPERRQHGLGHALVQSALQAARERPAVQLMQLSVSDGNGAALALYEAAGFQVYGHEPLAVALGEGFVTKLHLWRRL